MKDLIERAESTMKLILVVSLLLALAFIAAWNDPIAIGVRLYSAVKRLPEDQRSDSMKNFLRTVEQQTDSEKRDKLRQVKVDTALAIVTERGVTAPTADTQDLKQRSVGETLRELQAA
jgi:septal ring-binding cell division protein DamX